MTRWHQAFPETSLIDRYALEMRIGDLIVFGRNVSQLSASIDSLNYYYTRVKRTIGRNRYRRYHKSQNLTSPWTKFGQKALSPTGVGCYSSMLLYCRTG